MFKNRFVLLILTKKVKKMVDNRKFIADVFKTFDLKLSKLPERIAFQKTVYLLQELGSGTNFNFIWHNFGPYSQELAQIGFSLNDSDKLNANMLDIPSSQNFIQLKMGHEGDSKFLEMMADIVYLTKNKSIMSDKELFIALISHQQYLNDEELFKLSLQRLRNAKLI